MKKLLLLLVLFPLLSNAQNTKPTLPAWHVVESGAEFKVVMNGEGETELNAGEAVLVFRIENGKAYAFDAIGRVVVFSNPAKLTRGITANVSDIGIVESDIEIMGGTDLKKATIVWIVGQDVAKGTYKIQIVEGKTLDVSSSTVSLYYKKYYGDAAKDKKGYTTTH